MPPQPNESVSPVASSEACPWYQPLCRVTPVSKYLAMVIFILMPFVGGYIGYKMAGERVVEVPVINSLPNQQKVAETPVSNKNRVDETSANPSLGSTYQKLAIGKDIVGADQIAGYERDEKGIYAIEKNGETKRIATVSVSNPDAFEVNTTWPMYARDAEHVFVNGKIIPNADAATFVALCGSPAPLEVTCSVGKDDFHVYDGTEIITGIDTKTFVSLERFGKVFMNAGIDAGGFYWINGASTTKISTLADGSSIYFADTSKVIIDGVDTGVRWADYYDGLEVGDKTYFEGGYLVDGAAVYSIYSVIEKQATQSKSFISKVAKVGEKPVEIK